LRAVNIGSRRRGRKVGQAGLDVGVGKELQVVSNRTDGRDRREALFRFAAVILQVPTDQCVEQGVVVGRDGAHCHQNRTQRLAFVARPAIKGRQECLPVDKVVLKGQDAEQEVAVGIHAQQGATVARSNCRVKGVLILNRNVLCGARATAKAR
jgi:hypothetical protein